MIRKTLTLLFAQGLFLFCVLGLAEAKKPAIALTATEILNQMAKAYANCKTYQDYGVVITKFIQKSGERIDEKPFTTAFIRPDRFRYEYREMKDKSLKETRYIIWSKGKEVLVWWDVTPRIEKEKSLGMALAGATGVSGASAHTIPALLLPEVGGRLLTEIADVKRISDQKIDKVNCFRIEGKFGDDPIVLWIDAKSFLVRLITTRHDFPRFGTETITSYNPVVDSVISEKALDFDPPKQK